MTKCAFFNINRPYWQPSWIFSLGTVSPWPYSYMPIIHVIPLQAIYKELLSSLSQIDLWPQIWPSMLRRSGTQNYLKESKMSRQCTIVQSDKMCFFNINRPYWRPSWMLSKIMTGINPGYGSIIMASIKKNYQLVSDTKMLKKYRIKSTFSLKTQNTE